MELLIGTTLFAPYSMSFLSFYLRSQDSKLADKINTWALRVYCAGITSILCLIVSTGAS